MSVGYSDPIISAASSGFDDLDLTFGIPGVNAIRTFLTAHGWSNPGNAGTAASGTLTGIAFPSHPPSFGDNNAVPGNASKLGLFNGLDFVFWDPYWSGGLDPTGTQDASGLHFIGVPLGNTADASIANAMSALTTNTPWIFTLGPQDPATSLSHGTVIAKLNGPDWNVDSHSPAFYFSPNAANLTSSSPTTGGWYLYSTPNPVTQDQIRMWAYQGPFENVYTQLQFNGTDCPAHPYFFMTYYASAGSHQFSFQQKPGQTPGAGDNAGLHGGGGYHIASALHVPSDFAPQTINISGVDNSAFTDVVIHTTVAHGLVAWDRVRIKAVVGSVQVNSDWWVLDAPTTTTIRISLDGIAALQGDGAAYVSNGTLTYGLFESFFSSGDLLDKFATPTKTCIKTNGVFKTSWTSPHGANEGVMLPLFNIGDSSAPAPTSNGKTLLQPPYVATRIHDDHEAQIAGVLWNTVINLRQQSFADQEVFAGTRHMNWLQDATVSPIVQASLWVKSE